MEWTKLAPLLCVVGCAVEPAPAPAPAPAPEPVSAPPPGAPPPGPASTAPAPPAPPAPAARGSHKESLGVCWTDASCPRAMIVAHGGDWTPTGAPYGSKAALEAAFAHDVDSVKIDVRVTKDGVAVVSHSSPFEAWESLDCYGKKIEEMTAAAVTKCHFASKPSETYQRLDTMLAYAKGKMTVQLTVKEPSDFAKAIEQVLASKAEDFAFLEVSVDDLKTRLPAVPSSDKVYYLVNVAGTLADVDALLALKNPRVFMVEFDAGPGVASAIQTKVHPAGLKAFIYEKAQNASTAMLQGYFAEGFDVVSANATENNLKARVAVNTSRGVSPP